MKERKEERVDNFRQWLIDQDAEFTEHNNGHFQVFNGGDKLMDVWATTERCRLITGDGLVGINSIKKTIGAHIDFERA